MMRQVLTLACALALIGCASLAAPPIVASNGARLEQVEARLAVLQLNAVDAESYAFAEARAWYEFAFDAYAQGERGVVVREALAQAESILQRIECCGGVIHVQAPVRIARVRDVRADLWSQLARLQQHERFTCAQGDIARMRVQLIAAGHAYYDLGWRHARPYVRAAERFGAQAQRALQSCGTEVAEEPIVAPAVRRAMPQSELGEVILDTALPRAPRQ